jgi:hypothetical protein
MSCLGALQPANLDELLQQMPLIGTVLLGLSLCLGLVLWVFGGRLARKGVLLTGFVLGGLGAMGAATLWTDEGPWMLSLGIGGAVAGVLLAYLLFRFWIAISAAIVLAMVVPAAILVWEGSSPEWTAVDGGKQVAAEALGIGESYWDDPEERPTGMFESTDDNVEFDESIAEAGESSEESARPSFADVVDLAALGEAIRGEWQRQADEVGTWWQEMNAGQKRLLILSSLVGAGLGLLLGLVMPMTAAALQAALVGSILIFFSGQALLVKFAPASVDFLPNQRRGVLLTLGLITLVGVLLQWSIHRRSAEDKK